MPIKFGKKHGNGYHDSVYVKVKTTKNSTECSNEKIMNARIKLNLVIKNCPTTCEFFEKCIAKSGEVKEE